MLMRGGTSKGAYFVASDLPADRAERDDLLLRVMGTPDPRQIDGVGGSHPLTSKVAIVAAGNATDTDVEYLFLQIGVDERIVSDRQNCGNLLAGVGPFAIERRLVPAGGTETSVRIRMLNSDSIAVARFPTPDGRPRYAGTTSIDGVPGAGAAIEIEFEGIAGGTTGSLLPSGSPVDEIDGVACTLVDNGMPVVVMRAADLGVTGYEDCATLESDDRLLDRLESIRTAAGHLMGLGDVTGTTVPKLTLVAPPRRGGALATRTFIPHRCHDAIGVLGAVSVATAAMLPGTPAAEVTTRPTGTQVELEHPTGSFTALIDVEPGDDLPRIRGAGIVRTARKLMDGTVFPRDYP